ncbi:hypothetical protein Cgig2_022326 [Carnegiea gigantea]|uniref:Uncharacterized protein n=1 Tax=Carnegiea gigantea TaxID=171969 RepID=A0A9Q1GNU8_9CARY|nr:hypothetical protein Cgig2_022326 [Carnegiea gigantea]
MHEDICQVAEQKRVTMILLPFHKTWRKQEDGEVKVETVGHGWREVSRRVMNKAPCTVAVIVDRGFGENEGGGDRVCVVFFGGPDDREALELGARMADHPAVKVTVIRLVENNGRDNTTVMLRPSPEKCSESNYTFSVAAMNREEERVLDNTTMAEFRSKWEGQVEFMEREANNIEEAVLSLGRSGAYDLMVVGKGRFPSTMVAGLAERQAEHAELGPIADILSSSSSDVASSVLVVQQHDLAHAEEVPVCKVVHNENAEEDVCNQV